MSKQTPDQLQQTILDFPERDHLQPILADAKEEAGCMNATRLCALRLLRDSVPETTDPAELAGLVDEDIGFLIKDNSDETLQRIHEIVDLSPDRQEWHSGLVTSMTVKPKELLALWENNVFPMNVRIDDPDGAALRSLVGNEHLKTLRRLEIVLPYEILPAGYNANEPEVHLRASALPALLLSPDLKNLDALCLRAPAERTRQDGNFCTLDDISYWRILTETAPANLRVLELHTGWEDDDSVTSGSQIRQGLENRQQTDGLAFPKLELFVADANMLDSDSQALLETKLLPPRYRSTHTAHRKGFNGKTAS